MTPTIQVLANLIPAVQKIAAEAQRRVAAAPKVTDPAAVEKAASALVDAGWVSAGRKAEAIAALNTHGGALDTIGNLAVKSAEELGRRQDPRLAAGQMVGEPTKQADAPYESEADAKFLATVTAFKLRKAN